MIRMRQTDNFFLLLETPTAHNKKLLRRVFFYQKRKVNYSCNQWHHSLWGSVSQPVRHGTLVCCELLPSVPPICFSLLLLFFWEKRRHFGWNKVIFQGLFKKFLCISVPPVKKGWETLLWGIITALNISRDIVTSRKARMFQNLVQNKRRGYEFLTCLEK